MFTARTLTPRPTGALLVCLCACLFIAPAARAVTNTIAFDLGLWSSETVAYKPVKIEPVDTSFPRVDGVRVIGRDFGFKQTDALGRFTNAMVSGSYRITFTNQFRATQFEITVPATNYSGVLQASAITTASTNLPANLVAYSQAASDARYPSLPGTNILFVTNNGVITVHGTSTGSGGLSSIGLLTNSTPVSSTGTTNLNFSTNGNVQITGVSNSSGVTLSANVDPSVTNGIDARVTALQTAQSNDTNIINTVSNRVSLIEGMTNSFSSGSSAATSNALVGLTNMVTAKVLRGNLVAEYRMDEGSGQVIHNTAFPVENEYDNLLSQPQQNFHGSWPIVWSALGSAVVTQLYTNNPIDGAPTASRLTLGGTQGYIQSPTMTFEARDYTLSVWVKGNGESNQFFRMAYGGVQSSPFTASNAWQRYSFTFTATANTTYVLILESTSTNDPCDLTFYGPKLEAGSFASPYRTPSFHMVLGKMGLPDTFDPSWLNYGINATGSVLAHGMSADALRLSRASVYAVVRKTAAPVSASYMPIISDPYTAGKMFLSCAEQGIAYPSFKFSGSTVIGFGFNIYDGAWHILAGTYDGTNLAYWADGLLINTNAVGALSAVQITNLFLGTFTSSTFFPGEIAYSSIYSVAHQSNDVVRQTSALRSLVAARTISATNNDTLIVWEGDSITEGASAWYSYSYNWLTTSNLNRQSKVSALSGATIATITNRAAQVDALYDPNRRKNILVLFDGANEAGPGFTNAIKTYCQARRNVGWKVILATVLPRNNAAFNTNREIANTYLRTDTTFYDMLVDWGATNTFMGATSTAYNVTYYGDGVHPAQAGHALMYSNMLPAVSNLIVAP